MKTHLLNLLPFMIALCLPNYVQAGKEKHPLSAKHPHVVRKSAWIHGSANCKDNNDPSTDVYRHDDKSFILRQNKCLTYEAPFIYVLSGSEKNLVLDTGALKESSTYSLYEELARVLGEESLSSKTTLVLHTHGHSDHTKGDKAFEQRENVTLIKASAKEINRFFNFDDWPNGETTIDLGNRKITVIPTPGHQEESLSFYDHKTQWLITGDTLYPGVIYVKDWQAYRATIDRLAVFASQNDISAVLGAHIEMKNASADYYPIGSTFQPNEASLALNVQALDMLNKKLKASNQPTEIIFNDFIIKPMGRFQKMLSNAVRLFKN